MKRIANTITLLFCTVKDSSTLECSKIRCVCGFIYQGVSI